MRHALLAAVLAAAVFGFVGSGTPGWRSSHPIERLGAVIRVPNATATPPTVVLTGEVWLQATNLPEDEPVTVTLNAPDGTNCDLPSWQVQKQGREANTFAVPAQCSSAEGGWTATFAAGQLSVKAKFTAVPAPWFANGSGVRTAWYSIVKATSVLHPDARDNTGPRVRSREFEPAGRSCSPPG